MKIETTMAGLLEAEPALKRLGEVKLPAKTAYHLMKLTSQVQTETKYFHEQRDKLIKELGEEKEPGQFQVAPAQMGEYVTRVNELARLPVTLALDALPFAALENLELAAGDLLALQPLIAFAPDEAAEVPVKRTRPKAVAR